MKIYGFQTYNVTKVLLTAEELGLNYDYVALDPLKGEHKSQEHLRRHPLGQVPVLEHNGDYYVESAAICRYLARINGYYLYQGDAREKAVIDRWIDFGTLHVGRSLSSFFFQEVVNSGFFGNPVDKKALADARESLGQQLPLLDGQLAEQRFLAGDILSLADIIVFAYTQIHEVTSAAIDSFANLQRWYGEIRQRPSFRAAMKHFPEGQLFAGKASGPV